MASVSDRPWSDFTASSYPTPENYCASCLVDLNDGAKTKALCYLPYKEPGGAINRGGVHAAASVLAGGRGGVDIPQAAKVAAAKKAVSLYRSTLNEDPPESIVTLAGS
jgi:hypothetical protein